MAAPPAAPSDTLFSTAELDLQARVQSRRHQRPRSRASSLRLDLYEHLVGTVRLLPSQHTSRGVTLVDSVLLRKDPLGLYFSDICSPPPSDEYAPALKRFWTGGICYDLVVDATAACRGHSPSPATVALYYHLCQDSTVSLSTILLGALPFVVSRALTDLWHGRASSTTTTVTVWTCNINTRRHC